MKTILTIIVAGGIGLAAGLWLQPWWIVGRGTPEASRTSAGSRGRGGEVEAGEVQGDRPARSEVRSVHALGRVEPAGGLYPVGTPAGARVDRILVTLGQVVKEGQELAFVEGHAERKAQVALIGAQLAEARDQLKSEHDYVALLDQEAALEKESMTNLETSERATQEANIGLLAEKAKSSRSDYEHLVELNQDRRATISAQEIERQRLLMRQDEAALNNARAELRKYEATQKTRLAKLDLELKKSKAASARGSQAIPVRSLEKQLELAGEQVNQTIIRAPRDGRILAILAKPGETAGPKPVFQLGDTSRLYVVAEVDEDQIPLIRKDQRATIRTHAASRTYTGVVESWALMVAKNDVLGLDPTAAAYARVVEIKIKVDEPCDELRDRTYMQVNVDITLDGPAGAQTPGPEK